MPKASKFLNFLLAIAWITAWGVATYGATVLAEKPVYKDFSLTPHQNLSWNQGVEMKVKAGSSLIVRAEGANFTIVEHSSGLYTCTGTPVEMTASDEFQPFECILEPSVDTTYRLSDGFATVYTTSQANLEVEQPTSIGWIILICFLGAIFGTSIIVSLIYFLGL
ncbi:hypothetical protein A3K29_06035 [Candidatus Collierbacteria bacterium RIFOXYB2_FULL_46_14]|uniref:Uncharacterized protein n=1 Tax=Candidatus Collierbacteria bacterium GW2011_GWA2_46_26 TaxID=1618381 RepID=A0A0G1RQY2_9BACT|nr:MAG: hypothetical protein UX47_C0013G0027 [Candidatus Collierbacteria bacterium GW2011_GWA2_46_26]OGD73649.1 MAG: hypothetical protein A3K29_06035 [Candidatus Collierbacteria bacterium RIFOXYB2_FULL_46_14]OGD76691.1 MAG: hypothetical protein A3K43_06035 [Candidatus Collierbacteria bacterium RIFOXYA2_FULL_46_20]OGD78027.1 MAG: hypothetical protein A3K39_06035 [Candidatus Collierbacteria bacterium RIFOXYC2_FULL_43_15]OGD80051.1 MAG: hypothetical protein A2320_00465 [Pseudomonadales bacterium G